MRSWLRLHIQQFSLGLLALAVAGIVIVGVLSMRAQADLPPGQHAYWEWVRSINQNPDTALASGLALLEAEPQVPQLYLRLAQLCQEHGAVATCRDALVNIQPPGAQARLYREAAKALLDRDGAATPWQQLARAPNLDAALARLIVDTTPQKALETIEAIWSYQLGVDSAAFGAAFGLGYAAVLRYDWDTSEAMLTHALRLRPDEPQIYRELGRVYHSTGKADRLVPVLEQGLAAARNRYDAEQELILLGNLGWVLSQRTGDLEKAEKRATEALTQSRLLADGESEGFNQYRLAYILLQQHRYEEAIPMLQRADLLYARHVPHRHAEVTVLHGNLLSKMLRFSDAEQVLQQAIAEADESRRVDIKAQAQVELARLHFKLGRYEVAKAVGTEALALSKQHELLDHEITARLALGDAERRWGNYDGAGEHYQQVVALSRIAQNESRLRHGFYRLGLTALDLRDANTARMYFEEMLQSLEQAGQTTQQADAYLGLGRTYLRFEQVEQALGYFDRALALASHDPQGRANVLIAKAWAQLEGASYTEAEALFREAEHVNPASKAVAYRVELGLGDIAISQGACATALAHFREAEAINQERPSPSIYWYALFGKALASWCLGDLEAAEATFRQTVGVIEAFRDELDASLSRAYFVENKGRVYAYFAAFLEEQGRTQEAFHFIERARSRSLVDLLYTAQREQRTDMNEPTQKAIELDRRMRAIVREVAATESLNESASQRRLFRSAQLQREYQRADSSYRQLQRHLATERPIFTFNPLSAEEARASLEAGEAMVVYDVRQIGRRGHEIDASMAYIITPDQVVSQPLALESSRLAETIHTYRRQIGSAEAGPGQGWERTSQQLYQDLIAPVVEALPPAVRHVHIVPQGVLYYLPFATLQDADGRFLVERYTVSVTPSASILKLSRDRNPRQWSTMLLLGDPNKTLPGARREVQAIAQRTAQARPHVLLGEAVTHDNLVATAGSADIVHIATHGRFVPRSPGRSYLQLHGEAVLSVEAIGALRLDAYLVTLSACETALSSGLLGEVADGDEWVGLVQAFLAAGTPTVMASLWPIDDQVSSTFMTGFYQALQEGGKADALAAMQRRFIKDPRTQHPFYWAPFTLVGDPL